MEILWKIENLKKIYEVKSEFAKKKVVAIDGVSFEIYKGETFGIIGESGSGKTTLGKAIIRLIEPTEGKIFFRNTDISEMKETHLRPLRKKFQIIFQDPYKSLNPRIKMLLPKDLTTVTSGSREPPRTTPTQSLKNSS
ncbi:MAG TPA: ATP-binding cassette domain-containing protein [bacterium]|nr:ATP-binding cassette domain-containing protein [bacterium]